MQTRKLIRDNTRSKMLQSK